MALEGMSVHTATTRDFASRQAELNAGRVRESTDRLSSGYRIRSASDDSVGLAVSEKMRAQIRGANQARRNAQEAMDVLNLAESGMQETTDMLQRMRELVLQAANGTYTETDRSLIQIEIDELKEAIDQHAEAVRYNGEPLLAVDDDLGQAGIEEFKVASFTFSGDGAGSNRDPDGNGSDNWKSSDETKLMNDTTKIVQYAARQIWGRNGLKNDGTGFSAPSPTTGIDVIFAENTAQFTVLTGVVAQAAVDNFGRTLYYNLDSFTGDKSSAVSGTTDYTYEQVIAHEINHAFQYRSGAISFQAGDGWYLEGGSEYAGKMDNVMRIPNGLSDANTGLEAYEEGNAVMHYIANVYGARTIGRFHELLEGNEGGVIAAGVVQSAVVQAVRAVDDSVRDFATFEQRAISWITDNIGKIKGGLDLGIGKVRNESLPNQIFNMHIGSNEGQAVKIKTFLATTGGLPLVSFVNTRDQTEIKNSLKVLDAALDTMARARADMAATFKQIESAVNTIDRFSRDTQTGESRIRDTDMAEETVSLTRSQITTQSASAMLAQANLVSQNVLNYLQF